MSHTLSSLFIAPVLVVVACGGGPNPHDTSVAEHERIAREHDAMAASVANECATARPASPCWTATDRRTMQSHLDAAAQHRAASAELRAAEANACAGIPENDRVMSPLEHGADIASVDPLIARSSGSKAISSRQVGATVTFRATPGLTAEWLQREVDCHLARNAALGHVAPEMPDCPLVPRGVVAHVRSVGNGFAVDVESDDTGTAQEIFARAQRLIVSARTASAPTH